jgi:hypothetical protein
MKRVLIGVVVVLVLLVAGGVYYTLSTLDAIVKGGIEHYGSEMTGCRVRVGSVRIELMTGKGTIRGLRISNPSGFSSKDAFSLGEITVQFLPGGINETPLVIQQVVIAEPEVEFEVAGDGRINLLVINDNLSAYSPPTPKQPGDPQPGAGSPADASTDLLFRVLKFDFEAAKVTADATAAGGKVTDVSVPSLHLKNVGGKQGKNGAAIGQDILTAFTAKVTKKIAAQQLDGVIDEHLDGQAGAAAKELLRRFTK